MNYFNIATLSNLLCDNDPDVRCVSICILYTSGESFSNVYRIIADNTWMLNNLMRCRSLSNSSGIIPGLDHTLSICLKIATDIKRQEEEQARPARQDKQIQTQEEEQVRPARQAQQLQAQKEEQARATRQAQQLQTQKEEEERAERRAEYAKAQKEEREEELKRMRIEQRQEEREKESRKAYLESQVRKRDAAVGTGRESHYTEKLEREYTDYEGKYGRYEETKPSCVIN